MRDLHNNIAVVQLMAPQTITGDTYSSVLDLQDYESAEIVVNVGTCSTVDTDSNYVTPILQESDSLTEADYSSVTASDILNSFSAITTTASQVQNVGYIGSKRYIRVFADETGSVGAVPISVTAILHNARHNPPTAPTALATTG